jgi:hypothetical protein
MNTLNQDFSKLLEAIVAASANRAGDNLRDALAEIRQRLSGIERRLAILENVERASADADSLARSAEKICQSCDRRAVARGLCSAHYQQWRYRQKKAKLRSSLVDHFPDGAAGAVLNDDAEATELPT